MALLSAENQRVSNSAAALKSPLADDQFRELLRLRGEVGLLRKQTNGLGKLREENHRLRASLAQAGQNPQPSESDQDAEQQKPMGHLRMRNAMTLSHALIMYASKNHGQIPANYDLAAPFFANALRAEINPGETLREETDLIQAMNQFEIVFGGSRETLTNGGNVIMLREKQAWQTPDGKWAKAYAFADGHSEIHTESDGNFEAWEKQRMVAPAGQ